MSTDLATVMDQMGTALSNIVGLRVFDFEPDSAQPPFAFVAMPEAIDYDATYGRGSDRYTLKVYLGVGSVVDRAARDEIAQYAAGIGLRSVKATIDAEGLSVNVVKAEFGHITLAAGTFAGIIFHVDVIG